MNRVLAARSLKFSEHRSSDRGKEKSEVVVHKKSDGGKGKGYESNGKEKLTTPTVVAAIVQKEAIRKKKEPKGVWSPLGINYQTHGQPDLDLGEEANINELKKTKKARRIARDAKEARQKLENLMELFRTTKSSLLAVNLFNRSGPKNGDTEQTKQSIFPNLNEGPPSGASTPRAGVEGEEKKKEKSKSTELSTIQKIQMLGVDNQERKNKGKKTQEQETKLRMLHHLNDDTGSHLIRWRDSFEETKSAQDRALIQLLISRSEDKDRVYDSAHLLNNAVDIVSASLKSGPSHFATKSNAHSLWQKAQTLHSDHVFSPDLPHFKEETSSLMELGDSFGADDDGFTSSRRSNTQHTHSMIHSASAPSMRRGSARVPGARGTATGNRRSDGEKGLLKLPAPPLTPGAR